MADDAVLQAMTSGLTPLGDDVRYRQEYRTSAIGFGPVRRVSGVADVHELAGKLVDDRRTGDPPTPESKDPNRRVVTRPKFATEPCAADSGPR